MEGKFLTMDEQAILLRWAADRLGLEDMPADSQAMGVLAPDHAIMAVGVLNNFHDEGAWIHIAADHRAPWADRRILAQLFYVPFVHLGLHRVTGRVPAWNHKAISLNLRLGFQLEGREREGFKGKDMLVFGMLARECRWIEGV